MRCVAWKLYRFLIWSGFGDCLYIRIIIGRALKQVSTVSNIELFLSSHSNRIVCSTKNSVSDYYLNNTIRPQIQISRSVFFFVFWYEGFSFHAFLSFHHNDRINFIPTVLNFHKNFSIVFVVIIYILFYVRLNDFCVMS